LLSASQKNHAAAASACWQSCPRSAEPVQRLDNAGFNLGYSARKRQSLWVAYRVQALPKGRAAFWYRRRRFAPDPRIADGPNAWVLKGSGYDCGL
jgi:DNA/RNA endonuclease G (NUC1)